jgi:AAA family ATP:ADP antiporter
MSVSSCSSPNISLLSTFFLIVFALLIAFLIKKVGKDSLRGYVADKKKIGEKHSIPFLKGLGLILTSPYVSGLLFLTIAPDVLMSVVSFKWMKILESSFVFDKTKMITFIFDYNLIIQIVSCFFSLISSFFYNNFGVKKCIVFYPVCIFILVLLIMFFPSLLVATGALAFMKGLHYALNKPAREKLYIPTTKEVKYKSKAWIEVFGTRIFKATGASINKLPISFSSGFLIIMPFVWAAIASVVGSKYEESVKGNETVV